MVLSWLPEKGAVFIRDPKRNHGVEDLPSVGLYEMRELDLSAEKRPRKNVSSEELIRASWLIADILWHCGRDCFGLNTNCAM